MILYNVWKKFIIFAYLKVLISVFQTLLLKDYKAISNTNEGPIADIS